MLHRTPTSAVTTHPAPARTTGLRLYAALLAVAVVFLGACGGSAGALPDPSDFTVPPASTATSPGTGSAGHGGGTPVATAPSTTAPGSGAPIAYPPTAAYSFEIGLRNRVGGCWADASPGDSSGSYRQDLYYQSGACSGSGWAIDVEIYNSALPPATAGRSVPAGTVYRDANTLIVVAATASPSLSRLVATTSGLTAVGN